MDTALLQGRIFPGVLGLVSMAALGWAWWLHAKVNRGRTDGLAPLSEFRFNDLLVWVMVAGVGTLLLGGEAWARVGANTVVFMGGLYALRGMAVVLFVSGGFTVVGTVLAAAATLLLAPVVMVGAMLVGLGDTWLDLRTRARSAPGGQGQ